METIYLQRKLTQDDLEPVRDRYKWDEMATLAETVVFELSQSQQPNIGVLYDPDVDGLMSGFILKHYLERIGYTVKRHMNKGKVHGLKQEAMDWVEREGIDYLFIVDAGSGDSETINQLVSEGKRVIVLDHHDYDPQPLLEGATIVNAMNHAQVKDISGCAVVYYFIEELAQYFEQTVTLYEKYVGISILSDICSMLTRENRYFVKQAYDAIGTGYLFNYFDFYGSYSSYIAYKLVPHFNAMIRCDLVEEAMHVSDHFERRTFAKEMKAYLDVKEIQKEKVEQVKELGEGVPLEGLYLKLRGPQDEDLRPFNGLVANQYMSELNCSAIVAEYNPDNDCFEGSFRGYDLIKDDLEVWGITCQGHDAACGVRIPSDVLEDLILNFKHTINKKQTVDFIATSVTYSEEEWTQMAWFNEFYGKDLPKISVELTDKPTNIVYGQRKQELVFEGATVVEFGAGAKGERYIVEPTLGRYRTQLIRR